jgi:hypothetical protein
MNKRPPIRSTHTYVTLDVPGELYDLVYDQLKAAGYDHLFPDTPDGPLEMDGLALVPVRGRRPRISYQRFRRVYDHVRRQKRAH